MQEINTKNVMKLDILNNEFYSKLLIYLMVGNDTYSKLRDARKKAEGKKLAFSVLNIQISRLLSHKIIYDDGIKRKFNQKRFVVNKDYFLNCFFNYFKSLAKRKIEELDNSYSSYKELKNDKLTRFIPRLQSIFKNSRDGHKAVLNALETDGYPQTFKDFLWDSFVLFFSMKSPQNYSSLKKHFDDFILATSQLAERDPYPHLYLELSRDKNAQKKLLMHIDENAPELMVFSFIEYCKLLNLTIESVAHPFKFSMPKPNKEVMPQAK